MPASSRLVFGSAFAFLLIGFLVLMAIVGTNFWLGERAQFYFNQAIEIRDTRGAAVELRDAMLAAESSQRGYLVSGNEIYLAPYDTAKTVAQRQLASLKLLLAPFPDFATPLERLTSILSDKTEEMDQAITLKRARHDDEALALFRSNKGKALMDEANVFVSGIIKQSDARLSTGIDEQKANAKVLRLVSVLGGLLIAAVVGGSAFVLLSYTRELRQTRDELNTLNSALEQRVSERTADLAESRDRAQVLLSEVNHRVANSLALVSSLVSLQAKSVKDEGARTVLAETQDRIFAISLVHKRLYTANDARVVALDEYLAGLLEHLKTSLRAGAQGVSLTYALEPVKLATDASVNLGVVVTEWITNAFKYAYPHGTGEIRVRMRELDDGQIELVVEDDGVGRSEGSPAKGTGLGTRLVTAMAASLRAAVSYDAAEPGTRARLTFMPAGRADAAAVDPNNASV